ncbi:MAG: Omp28-related outer membrane protein [Chlorobi bacterium]|nr:Omp28-related outer membrane protein [Chlorobiota bacterium]
MLPKLAASMVVFIALMGGISGCDVITPPYTRILPQDTTTPTTGMVRYRAVLVEEFTGAQCTNCPLGHRKLDELSKVYRDSVVVVSIHAGEFAKPDLRRGYTADFRTPEGEELNSRFRVFAYPAAVINRTKIDGTSYVLGVQNWGSAIASQLRTSTPFAISTQALCDTAEGIVRTRVRLESLAPINSAYNIAYYIVEDSLVAPQLDLGTFVANYVHRHVLRSAPLGAYGEPLVREAIPQGTVLERTYTYNISQKPWNPKHLEVVVFVAQPEPDYTVVQAAKAKVLFQQR